MWDVKGALTWPGDDGDEGKTVASSTTSYSVNSGTNSNTGHSNANTDSTPVGDSDINNHRNNINPSINDNNSNNNDINNTAATEEGEGNREGPSADAQNLPPAPIHNTGHDEDDAALSSHEDSQARTTSMEDLEGGTGVALADAKGRHAVGSEANDGGGSVASTEDRGHSTLWPSEPSESVSGEDYGDR